MNIAHAYAYAHDSLPPPHTNLNILAANSIYLVFA